MLTMSHAERQSFAVLCAAPLLARAVRTRLAAAMLTMKRVNDPLQTVTVPIHALAPVPYVLGVSTMGNLAGKPSRIC
jgi:hypothetical protein